MVSKAVNMAEEEENEVPISARRTESLDAPDILGLVSHETGQLFGRVNIVQLIEKANMSISLVDEKNRILGHASFLDYPNRDFVEQNKWEPWLKSTYNADMCTPVNTLFMHFFVSKPDFSHGSLTEIMRTLFNAVPVLHFVILIVPKDTKIGSGISKIFEPLLQKNNTDELPHEAYVCQRYNHCPVLYIRGARVEDHDDLMPIFNRHNAELTAMYGDFFLSELIEAQDEQNKTIVADVDGTAFGFMSLSSDVDIKVLDKCFELEPFNGLKSVPKKLKPKEAVEEKNIVKRDSFKSRPATEISITIKTEDSSSPTALSVTSPTHKPGEDVSGPPGSTLPVSAGRKGKSPVAKGSFHRTKQKSAKPKDKDAEKAEKVERAVTPLKTPAPDEHPVDVKPIASEVERVEEKVEEKPNDDVAETEDIDKKEDFDEPEEELEELEAVESALCIQLFCIDEKYEMRSMDFLTKVFELFPHKDFCIVTIPHTVPEFPLLQSFKRATPKPESTLSQELYVFHRNGLLSSINVRSCKEEDQQRVEKLTRNVSGKEQLMKDVKRFLDAWRDKDGTPIKCYVAECVGQIIGISVIRQEEDIEFIRAHYNIEDFVYFNHHKYEEHGHLNHFVINPAFAHFTKHFLKEILRLSTKSCLYYPLYKSLSDAQVKNPHSLVTCLNELVPIRMRRQIVYPLKELGINAPSKRILADQAGYSLFHINRKLTLEPKIAINVRVVVVGASDVGVSCLDSLIHCPHLCFNNLTLVSTNGLKDQLSIEESKYLPHSLCFNAKEYDAMALSTWVNVIEGKMNKIDRVNKQVVMSNGKRIPYDHLLLCTGQQFQHPIPSGADIKTLITTDEVMKKKLPRSCKGPIPKNIFMLNNKADVDTSLQWIKEILLDSLGAVLVYGASLDAYSFIHGILETGIKGERVILVKPPSYSPSCFNNPSIEEIIDCVLKQKGVTIYEDCMLAGWNDEEDDSEVRCATFTTSAKPIKLQCQAFFCFQEKRVDYDAFKAINDSCLVYDGKLVIDTNFCTNDQYIKAAGSLTKYARKYHAGEMSHSLYNSKEIGAKLADSLLNIFDPTLDDMERLSPDDQLIPVFSNPKIQTAILPGGFRYLHVAKPSVPTPLASLMMQPEYGQELVTKDASGDNYFRIHLNQYNTIQTLTCLSKQDIDIDNLVCLYSIHERFLNNLLQRYNEGLIKDFYSYFRESWCLAIFHDRFNDFRSEVQEILAERQANEEASLEERVRKIIADDLALSKEHRVLLGDAYKTSRAKKLVEQRLLSYLSYNQYHLPMYAKPGLV
ncbi:cilia- and flagella-associated protein 61-like isoform X1 [Rhopilema esculentum]|uniref:cilia- and flagella-associated protein 61-like isoform X1 n=1 Tax=Rhopilema esculentum TaxID=499914 RepID=UPI0031D481BF